MPPGGSAPAVSGRLRTTSCRSPSTVNGEPAKNDIRKYIQRLISPTGDANMKFKKLFGRKKQNRRAPRVNEFMLESLEPRLLLSATPMTAAVVTTDHLDYAPGETAVITSSSQAGELVRFQVSRTDGMADGASTTADVGPAGDEAWYVIDGIGGFTAYLGSDVSGDGAADWIAPDNDLAVNSSISTTWFVEEQYRNSSLLVTAVGQEFGAVATQAFTDAKINTTTVVSSTIATSTYGDTVTFTGNIVNTSKMDLSGAWVVVAVMDAQDNLIAANSTYVFPTNEKIVQGETTTFEVNVYLAPGTDTTGFTFSTFVQGDE